jgi:hypothetical protein
MIPQAVYQCLCLITFPVDHSIGPVEQVRSKKPWSLTYRRTLVLHYLLQSRAVWTVLLYIFIKQRHVQTFWDIIHVCHKYLNKYVRRGICLIYMSSFYFWSLPLARKMRKTNVLYYPVYLWLFGPPWGPEGNVNIGKPSYFNLPPDIGFTLFTPIKGRIDSLTVYILEPSVCQKNTKNQYAVLHGISVRVLASHFNSVIGNFRSSGWLDLHVWYLKTFVNASAW